jgi:tetratricopeptide (TPR) repeat protein
MQPPPSSSLTPVEQRLSAAREAIAAVRFADAMQLLRGLLADTAHLPGVHFEVLMTRCIWHYYQPETAAAIEWGQRAIEHAQTTLTPAHEAHARALLANVRDLAGDIDGALSDATLALASAAREDGLARARACAAIAHIAQRAGEEALCFSMLRQGIDAAVKHDAVRSSLLLVAGAAQARFALEHWWTQTLEAHAATRARVSVVSGTQLNAVLGTGTNHGRGLIAEGEALLAQSRFAQAQECLAQGIAQVQDQGASELADAISLNAYCLARLGRVAEALPLAQQARVAIMQAVSRDPELRLTVLRSVAEVMRLAAHPQAELARIEWLDAQAALDAFRTSISARLHAQITVPAQAGG